jgi:hypothetical protein
MHLVTLCFQYASGDHVNGAAVSDAIKQYRATMVRRLMPDDYKRLAEIARRQSVPRDDLTRRLLFQRWALEYEEDGNPWIDVHPLILEADEFQDALKSRS